MEIHSSEPSEDSEDEYASDGDESSADEGEWQPRSGGVFRLADVAMLLWADNYESLFELEFQLNRQICGERDCLPPSTYRQRLVGERAEAYDARRRRQERDEMAIALHGNNMRHWSPSLCARSICYFKLTSQWVKQARARVPARLVRLVGD